MDLRADLRLIDAAELERLVPMVSAVRAVQDALRMHDPSAAAPRTITDVRNGQLLLMPAELGGLVGVKLASVAPANPAADKPRIQGLVVVLDAETLTPRALIDGTALTSLRTPAVSAAIVDVLADPDARRLAVFGAGPQAVRHVEAMRAIRPIEQVLVVGRDPDRAASAAREMAAFGVEARVGAASAANAADIVVTATSARTPIVDHVRTGATVVAVGSHEPDARELSSAVLADAHVVVETLEVARTEAGDVLLAIDDGVLDADDLVLMRDVVTGAFEPDPGRTRIVKTCGMGWQDLAVAAAALGAQEAA